MVTEKEKIEFSARLNEHLDDNNYEPKGTGRQAQLARDMTKELGGKISQIGVRKWLEAESIPRHNKILILANFLTKKVRPEWLEYGTPPKRPQAFYEQDQSGQSEFAGHQGSVNTGKKTEIQELFDNALTSAQQLVLAFLRESQAFEEYKPTSGLKKRKHGNKLED